VRCQKKQKEGAITDSDGGGSEVVWAERRDVILEIGFRGFFGGSVGGVSGEESNSLFEERFCRGTSLEERLGGRRDILKRGIVRF
jgi:hypothetical protein